MKVTNADVEKIAKLANLEIPPEEKEKFARQLSDIITYMEKLNELDTQNVQPTYHVHDMVNVFREDETKKWLTQKEATANAPKKWDGYFRVPKVISKD